MKPTTPNANRLYNPARLDQLGDGRLSDEESGNQGMQEAAELGTEDADRTRPVDVDIHESHTRPIAR